MLFFNVISLLKLGKEGFIYRRTAELTWRARLTWHARPARMRRGTQGNVAELARPTRRARGTHVSLTRGRRPRGSMRTSVRGATWQGGLAVGGPQRVVFVRR